MPLPRYLPVPKKPKMASLGPSMDDLNDKCLAKIIAYALEQSKASKEEPFVGDNGQVEKNLSLVSRRWYFLTQMLVSEHGVHKLQLDTLLQETTRKNSSTLSLARKSMSASKTPRIQGLNPLGTRTPGTFGATNRLRMRPNGILSQRNLFPTRETTCNKQAGDFSKPTATSELNDTKSKFSSTDLRLFKEMHSRMLKYNHVQLSGSLKVDNFDRLIITLNATRIERLDVIKLRIDGARSYSTPKKMFQIAPNDLAHLQSLTLTWTNDPKDDASNALLWTIYERATNLRQLEVYLIDVMSNDNYRTNNNNSGGGGGGNNSSDSLKSDSQRSTDSTGQMPSALQQSAICNYNGKWAKPLMSRAHPHLAKIIFNRVYPNSSSSPSTITTTTTNEQQQQQQILQVNNCDYSILIKRVLSQERSIKALETNDCSLIDYLIQASARVCTKNQLARLRLTHPIRSLDQLQHLMRLPNLGQDYLSIVIDNIELIGELKSLLDFASLRARYQLNLYLRDQKYTDCEDKVKNLIHLCRMADVNVYISALQRISIDCCHLMWSTGRGLQAITTTNGGSDTLGKCVFKISLQTYPVRPNTVNPCEITIPFGRCSDYKISSIREDVARHREIMRSLKRDCYHQFVKSVREN